jgi:hypothetical protein
MKHYEVSVDIAAPIEAVWHVLTQEVPKNPTPFGILRLEGALAQGSRIKLWSEVDPKRAFTLTVATFEPLRQMVWRGGMPLGLFTGTRTFALTQAGGQTHFSMKEVFGGALSGLIVKSIPDLTPSFRTFAQALKERAESHD